MASNEHKNLQDSNRHNPLGFEVANNSTILTKGLGTGSTLRDGNLEWISKEDIKTRMITLSGYCSLLTNYSYPEAQVYGQSPYDINQDYGSATISGATLVNQSKFFRIGQLTSVGAATIMRGELQVANSNAEAFTVALVKYVPSAIATTVAPSVMIEKSVVGLSDNNLVNPYTLIGTDFALTEISAGDHMFLMIKADGATAAPQVYANLTIELGFLK
tara:strand:+ start:803 stop:1453 length:651 start_codon:yes stop_codon:yes gene_type:complete